MFVLSIEVRVTRKMLLDDINMAVRACNMNRRRVPNRRESSISASSPEPMDKFKVSYIGGIIQR